MTAGQVSDACVLMPIVRAKKANRSGSSFIDQKRLFNVGFVGELTSLAYCEHKIPCQYEHGINSGMAYRLKR